MKTKIIEIIKNDWFLTISVILYFFVLMVEFASLERIFFGVGNGHFIRVLSNAVLFGFISIVFASIVYFVIVVCYNHLGFLAIPFEFFRKKSYLFFYSVFFVATVFFTRLGFGVDSRSVLFDKIDIALTLFSKFAICVFYLAYLTLVYFYFRKKEVLISMGEKSGILALSNFVIKTVRMDNIVIDKKKSRKVSIFFLVIGYLSAFPEIIALTICSSLSGFCGLPVVWQLALVLYLIEIVSFYQFSVLYKEYTKAWRWFAVIFVPLTLLIIVLTPESTSGGWIFSPPDREEVTWWFMQIFTFLSTIILLFTIVPKMIRENRSPKEQEIQTNASFFGKIAGGVLLFIVTHFAFNSLSFYEGVLNVIDIDDGIVSFLASLLAIIFYLMSFYVVFSALKRKFGAR